VDKAHNPRLIATQRSKKPYKKIPTQRVSLIKSVMQAAQDNRSIVISYTRVSDGKRVKRNLDYYSLRLRKAGGRVQPVLFGYHPAHNSIEMYVVKNIHWVKPGRRKYEPIWPVEIGEKGIKKGRRQISEILEWVPAVKYKRRIYVGGVMWDRSFKDRPYFRRAMHHPDIIRTYLQDEIDRLGYDEFIKGVTRGWVDLNGRFHSVQEVRIGNEKLAARKQRLQKKMEAGYRNKMRKGGNRLQRFIWRDKPSNNYAFRGVSFVELKNIYKTKQIKSHGKMNIFDKEPGKTYFSDTAVVASSRAADYKGYLLILKKDKRYLNRGIRHWEDMLYYTPTKPVPSSIVKRVIKFIPLSAPGKWPEEWFSYADVTKRFRDGSLFSRKKRIRKVSNKTKKIRQLDNFFASLTRAVKYGRSEIYPAKDPYETHEEIFDRVYRIARGSNGKEGYVTPTGRFISYYQASVYEREYVELAQDSSMEWPIDTGKYKGVKNLWERPRSYKRKKRIKKSLSVPDGPNISPEGKAYTIIWANGKGLTTWKTRKQALQFIRIKGDDVNSFTYGDKKGPKYMDVSLIGKAIMKFRRMPWHYIGMLQRAFGGVSHHVLAVAARKGKLTIERLAEAGIPRGKASSIVEYLKRTRIPGRVKKPWVASYYPKGREIHMSPNILGGRKWAAYIHENAHDIWFKVLKPRERKIFTRIVRRHYPDYYNAIKEGLKDSGYNVTQVPGEFFVRVVEARSRFPSKYKKLIGDDRFFPKVMNYFFTKYPALLNPHK